jgi:hypothetical protein
MAILTMMTAVLCAACLPADATDVAEKATPCSATNADRSRTASLLPPVIVTGQRAALTEAEQIISRDLLEALPIGNGSLNDFLPLLPDIQLSDQANTSLLGGEILPPPVSIAGGRTYDNNYTIDGLGNNSRIDPTADNYFSPTELPGHPQATFLDPTLIDQVTVYENNVPARFGGFTGGVIDARTVDPRPAWGGTLRYRTTRDNWTRFHIDDRNREDFLASDSHKQQPEFEKHDGGLTLNIPLTQHAAALLSYQLRYSKIPLQHFLQPKSQQRRLENFFFKYLWRPSSDSALRLSVTSSPYESRYFRSNYRNSDITLTRNARKVAVEYQQDFPLATWQIKTAWQENATVRDAPADMKFWAVTPSKPWGDLADTHYSMEGFFGDIENRQQSFEVRNSLGLTAMSLGKTEHALSAGVDYQHLAGKFRRSELSHYYYSPVQDASVACGADSPDCVAGEQYFSKRLVFQPQTARAELNLYDLFGEDILTWKRLELRLGLRLSLDDFQNNANLAHRLATAWDLFGHRDTVLVGGINRYYGNNLLTYKLREAKKPTTREIRSLDANGQPQAWETDSSYRYTRSGRYSSLNTPYVDEYTVGFDQRLLGGKLAFRYVKRYGRDEFAHEISAEDEDGVKHYLLNNNGHSRHRSYVLSWERRWRNHYLQINGTYQKSTSSNEDYDDMLDEEDLLDRVWYAGSVMHKTDLPRTDFNRSLTVNMIYVGQLPWGFSFSVQLKGRGGYRCLAASGNKHELPDGEIIPVYEKITQPGAIMINCGIDWRLRIFARQEITLSVEINNLLDKKAHVGKENDEYEMGRQLWVGMKYRF